jgi:hypothetical protein
MPKHRAVLYLLPSEKIIYRGEAIKSLSIGEGLARNPQKLGELVFGEPHALLPFQERLSSLLKKKKRSP